jgi:glucose-6-phosphate 1-dehydrogenase
MTNPATTQSDVLVIFGITGDLAKKQTFRALYRMERRGELQCPIVGVARKEWSAATLREHARRAIEDSGEKISDRVFGRLAERLSMVSGDYQDPKTYDRVAQAIEGRHLPVFYLEIPPSLFGRVVAGLAGVGLTAQARIAVEKPFGHDLASARALNAELHRFVEERQIYRVDHFLGKEPTMDILYLRFANSVFEPLWNRDRIQSVQVTLAEDFGVEDRGAFYDPGRGAA